MASFVRRSLAGLAVVALLAAGSPPPAARAAGATLHVPVDYATIQAAIDAASSGDTVQVSPGTYNERLTATKAITIESTAGAATTTIDAGHGGTAVILNNGVTFRGFTVRNGGPSDPGGISAGTGVIVEQNRIVNNQMCGEGGGITAAFSNAIIRNNEIANNSQGACSGGVGGGGIAIRGAGTVQVRDNVIEYNSHGSFAGGIALWAAGAPVIDGNTFRGNTGGQGGAISIVNDSGALITNNLFDGNFASQGGAIYANTPSLTTPLRIINNTFADNSAPTAGTIYAGGYDASTEIRNNVLTGSTVAALLSCPTGYDNQPPIVTSNDVRNDTGPGYDGLCSAFGGTNGNLSADPKYKDAPNHDFHLRPDSPLIDVGSATSAPAKDVDKDDRPFDGDFNGSAAFDIGFDEATDPLLIAPGSLDIGDVFVTATGQGTVSLTNDGNASLSITSVAISGPDAARFTIAAPADDSCTGATLAKSQGCSVKVTFTPTSFGSATATLTLTGPGAVGTREVPLAGEGLDPILVSGPPVFGTVPKGSSSDAKVIQVNDYGPPATVTSVTIGGTNAADFTIEDDGCSGYQIPTAQACQFSVRFKPSAIGARTATVTITGPSPVGTRHVALNGTGSTPSSGVSWTATAIVGPSNTWNAGYGLARTVKAATQYLHALYATDRVSGRWASDTGPYVGVYYLRSTNGTSWTTGKRLNPTNQHAARLGIAAAGSRVYAVWASQTKIDPMSATAPRVLYLRVNTNHGDSAAWRSIVRLSPTTGRVDYPTVAASGSDVHVAWTDSVTGTVKLASSTDGGATFKTVSLGTTTAGTSANKTGIPAVAVSGSTVIVVWLGNNSGAIKARVSTNRGKTWGSILGLASTSNGYFGAAVRGSRIGVTWTDGQGVIYRQRTLSGWAAPVVVVPTDGVHGQAAWTVALQDPNRVALTWTEDADAPGWSSLRWIESADGGASWYAQQTIETSDVPGRRANDFASVLWPSASTRYIVWNGWVPGGSTSYRLWIRRGTGLSVATATTKQATPYRSGSAAGPATAGDGNALQPSSPRWRHSSE